MAEPVETRSKEFKPSIVEVDGIIFSERPPDYVALLKQFASEPANRICADCGDFGESMKHSWISTNLGVFICINCAGAHRSLGTHISQTICLELDSLENVAVIEHILKIGNVVANSYWLAHGSKGVKNAAKNHLERIRKDRRLTEKFIEAKYCGKDFSIDSEPNSPTPRKISGASRICAGLLRIKLIKGTSLQGNEEKQTKAKPFITFQCGNFSVTSRVSQTLNPEWNQTFMMNLDQPNLILNIGCWDSDFVQGMNGSFGFGKISTQEFVPNKECRRAVKLDTQGEIDCLFELTPLE